MRVAVYTDYEYHLVGGKPYAERAFVLFIREIARHASRTVVLGRLDPRPGKARYALGDGIEFVALPYYKSLSRPWDAIRLMGRAGVRYWRSLADVDVVWLLGPNPVAIVFAILAMVRRRGVVLGVRQNYPEYIRARHRGRRGILVLAGILDSAFRLLARIHPVVVVGPELLEAYRHAPEVLEIAVSLVAEEDIVSLGEALERRYDGELRVLSVGRLESEKNPLLLAHALAELRSRDPRWKLVVCGEGPMLEELRAELKALGVAESAEVRGYVSHDGGLAQTYRESHVLLHVSWTEGLPQVLLESLAAGLPTVATDVGGIRAAVGGATRLIPPGDAAEAARALEGVVADPEAREALIAAGLGYIKEHTLESESLRVAEFLAAAVKR